MIWKTVSSDSRSKFRISGKNFVPKKQSLGDLMTRSLSHLLGQLCSKAFLSRNQLSGNQLPSSNQLPGNQLPSNQLLGNQFSGNLLPVNRLLVGQSSSAKLPRTLSSNFSSHLPSNLSSHLSSSDQLSSTQLSHNLPSDQLSSGKPSDFLASLPRDTAAETGNVNISPGNIPRTSPREARGRRTQEESQGDDIPNLYTVFIFWCLAII